MTKRERLQTVSCLKLEFSSDSPKITLPSYSSIFQTRESAIESEVQRLLNKDEKIKCDCESGEYILLIFIRRKLDGLCRFILNLSSLFEDVSWIHFKMEILQSVYLPLLRDVLRHHWT